MNRTRWIASARAALLAAATQRRPNASVFLHRSTQCFSTTSNSLPALGDSCSRTTPTPLQ